LLTKVTSRVNKYPVADRRSNPPEIDKPHQMSTPSLIGQLDLGEEWAEATYKAPFIRELKAGLLSDVHFDEWLKQVRIALDKS
jgi:hypothetical protein